MPSRIIVELPKGKYCTGCKLLNDGCGLEYQPTCQLLSRSLEQEARLGYNEETILKNPGCPDYPEEKEANQCLK